MSQAQITSGARILDDLVARRRAVVHRRPQPRQGPIAAAAEPCDHPVMRPRRYSLAVELTAHCNQKCSYCYNGWREDNGAALVEERGERLLARVERVLEAIAFDHVTITGGEPFSSADVWPLLALLDERGLEAQIISNGGLITDAVAERLAGHRVRY